MWNNLRFKHVFIAIFLGTALVVAAWMLMQARPDVQTEQPSAEMVKATGKCASCHHRETPGVVKQFQKSAHAREGVTCLDCHQPADGQETTSHRGFEISENPTSKNCASCHSGEYDEYARSRHAGPAWAAVRGREDFSDEQLEFAKQHHPEAVDRDPNRLAELEGPGAIEKGCGECHSIGKPNDDGSFGTCTDCHSRHNTSLELARRPRTCGQCHMGPDHSQLEIYRESKHGVLFHMQQDEMNLDADPKELSTEDMSVPTCSTCHMSGLEGMDVTHDVGERLSWYLFSPVSEKRDGYKRGQEEMKEVCSKCHAESHTDRFYEEAETVVDTTNKKVAHAEKMMDELYDEGLLTEAPFDEKIEFVYFDLWHYYGRTAKHGAFMGGADFVQWHGNYELLHKQVKLDELAEKYRQKADKSGESNDGDGDSSSDSE